MKPETEQTPEGEQTLIHGVKPLRAIDREMARKQARDAERKAKAQEPSGLFNDAQMDLADYL